MRALVLGALVVGTLGGPAFAVDPSLDALVRSGDVPYRGMLVINGETVVKVVHGTGDRKRQEIMSPGRMHGDLIVDNGKTFWHFSPRTQKVDLSPTRQWGERIADRLRLLTRNYRLKMVGCEMVAGRSANVVELRSSHPDRGSQRLWLDQDHAVPLRSERRNAQGRLVERNEFREISFPGQVDPSQFLLELPANVAITTSVRLLASGRTLADFHDSLPFAARLPAYLPSGFEGMDLHLFESKGVTSLHWRLSDGLATLSLFMTDRDHHPDLPTATAVALAPNREAHLVEQPGRRMLCWTDQRLGYAMVGDLSQSELVKVARSTLSDE